MGHRWPSRACYDSTSHISMVQESWEAVGKKDVLYDLPVSNHGARCRMIVYAKNLGSRIDIRSPEKLGGLKVLPISVFSQMERCQACLQLRTIL